MPWGGKRTGAGRPRLSPGEHVLRGTWRPSRHGPRPATVGALAVQPMPAGDWVPDAGDLASLGTAGRVLVQRLLARYDFAPIEGLLVEAAHAADALATVRAAEQPDIITTRLEMQLSRHFAALLAQLHVETPA